MGTIRGGLDWRVDVDINGANELKEFLATVKELKKELKGVRGGNITKKAQSDILKNQKAAQSAQNDDNRAQKQRLATEKQVQKEREKGNAKTARTIADRAKRKAAASKDAIKADRSLADANRENRKRSLKETRDDAEKRDRITRKTGQRKAKQAKADRALLEESSKAQEKALKEFNKREELRRKTEDGRVARRDADRRKARERTAKQQVRTFDTFKQESPQAQAVGQIKAANLKLETQKLLNSSPEFQRIQKSLKAIKESAPGAAKGLGRARKSAEGFVGQMRRLIKVVIILEGVRFAIDSLRNSISASIGRAALLEQSLLGIATVISATGQGTDPFGETLDGAAKLQGAFRIAGEQLDKLRLDSLRTAATLEELTFAFQTGLGPGLAAGLNIDEVRTFSVRIAQAAAAIGLQQNQLAEEIRSILSGTINQKTTRIASVLNISNEDIRKAKETGKLAEFLTEQFEAFGVASQRSLRTYNVLLVNTQDLLKQLGASGLAPLFEELKGLFEDIITTVTGADLGAAFEIDSSIVAQMREIGDAFADVVGGVRELVAALDADDFDGILSVVSGLGDAFEAGFSPAVQGLIDALTIIGKPITLIAEAFTKLADNNPEVVKLAVTLGVLGATALGTVGAVTALVAGFKLLVGTEILSGIFAAQVGFHGLAISVGTVSVALLPIAAIIGGIILVADRLFAITKGRGLTGRGFISELLGSNGEDEATRAGKLLAEYEAKLQRVGATSRDTVERLNKLPAVFTGQAQSAAKAREGIESLSKTLKGLTQQGAIDQLSAGLTGAVKDYVEADATLRITQAASLEGLDTELAQFEASRSQAEENRISAHERLLTSFKREPDALQKVLDLQSDIITKTLEQESVQDRIAGLNTAKIDAGNNVSVGAAATEELAELTKEADTLSDALERLQSRRDGILKRATAGRTTEDGRTELGRVQSQLEALDALESFLDASTNLLGIAGQIKDVEEARLALTKLQAQLQGQAALNAARNIRTEAKGTLKTLETQLRVRKEGIDIANVASVSETGARELRAQLKTAEDRRGVEEEIRAIEVQRTALTERRGQLDARGGNVIFAAQIAIAAVLVDLGLQEGLQREILEAIEEEANLRGRIAQLTAQQVADLAKLDRSFRADGLKDESAAIQSQLDLELQRVALNNQSLTRHQRVTAELRLQGQEVSDRATADRDSLNTLKVRLEKEKDIVGAVSDRGIAVAAELADLEVELELVERRAEAELAVNDAKKEAAAAQNGPDAFTDGVRQGFLNEVATDAELGEALALNLVGALRSSLQTLVSSIFDPNQSFDLRNAVGALGAAVGEAMVNSIIEQAIIQPLVGALGSETDSATDAAKLAREEALEVKRGIRAALEQRTAGILANTLPTMSEIALAIQTSALALDLASDSMVLISANLIKAAAELRAATLSNNLSNKGGAEGGAVGFAGGGSTNLIGGGSVPMPASGAVAPAGLDRRDKVSAHLRRGEFVSTPPLVRALANMGLPPKLLHAYNKGQIGMSTLTQAAMRTLGTGLDFSKPRADLGRGRINPRMGFAEGGLVGSSGPSLSEQIVRGGNSANERAATSQGGAQPVLVIDEGIRRQIIQQDILLDVISGDPNSFRTVMGL